MVGARVIIKQHQSPNSNSASPKLAVNQAISTTPSMMDIGSDFAVQSPTVMAQQDQLPSPVVQDARGSLSQQIDMAQSPHAKMRRRSIKGGPSVNTVKRSLSTPNVRGMSTASDAAMSLAEKRRNKLGYHRTSVACVHCRRRKIRCLLAPDDPQKRCSNCIRLKKECNFFPVDQQPPVERRPRTGSKAEGTGADTSTSSSSSPSMATPHIGDHGDHFNYSQMPMSAHSYTTSHMGPLSATTMSPPGSAAPITTRFEVPEHPPPGVGWDPRFFDSQQMPTGHPLHEDHPNGYWKMPEQPMTPSFSPYSSGPPSSLFQNGSFSSYSSAPSTRESGWQPQPHPMRSMSYGHVEDPHHRTDSHPAPYHPDMRRSTVDMLPPSLHSSANSSVTSMAESPVAPLSGPQTSQSMMHYHPPPGWNAVPSQSPKTMDFGSGWYQEPSQLSKVQEEDVVHFTDHPQSAMYASTGTH